MARGNTDSIARLIARELRSRTKRTCPKCEGWVMGETGLRESAAGCGNCGGKGWV